MANNKKPAPAPQINDWEEVSDWEEVGAAPAGQKVYDQPVGPPQANLLDQLKENVRDPARWEAALMNTGPYRKDVVAGMPPLAAPASASLTAVKAAQVARANPVTRLASGVGTAAAEGFVRPGAETMDDRIENAKTAAKWAGGFGAFGEAVGGAARVVQSAGSGSKKLGGALTRLKPDEAASYANDPKLAEEVSSQFRTDPMGFSERVRTQTRTALDTIKEKSAPIREKLGQKLTGKSVRLNPKDFEGTAIGEELQRAQAANPAPQRFAEVRVEPAPPKDPLAQFLTSTNKKLEKGQPLVRQPNKAANRALVEEGMSSQKNPLQGLSFEEQTAAMASGKPVPSSGFTPGGKSFNNYTPLNPEVPSVQRVPLPPEAPSSMTIPAGQAQRLKRVGQKAADFKYRKDPMAYSAADDLEAQAAAKMRKALDGVAPETVELNDILEQQARMRTAAQSGLDSPSKLMSNSEALGNTPAREMRQYLDKQGGSQLESLADALAAGQALENSSKNADFIDRMVAIPAGKALLRQSNKIERVGRKGAEVAQDPALRQLLLEMQRKTDR
jgi:hypothetical protein